MKISKLKMQKLTLKNVKIIGAICLMGLVVIISFGFIGKGCGGGEEDSRKAETDVGVENPTADGTNRSNLNVNVKMNIKAGKHYYIEIYLEGYKENKFAKALNADAPTTSASFYASPGELTIYADLYEADTTGNKTDAPPIGSDIEEVTIPDSLENVNAYLTIKIDEDSGETEFVFAVAEVIANASINSAPEIGIISTAATAIDYKNKKVRTIVHFSANDSEEGDCCRSDSACEIAVDTLCEDKAIADALFLKENVDDDAANDNKCEGSVSMSFPDQADFGVDNIYNCRIEIKVVDSGKTGVSGLDPKYYVQATGTYRIKIDLPKEKFSLTEKEPEPEAPTNGLVGYWNFDEGSGNIVKDSSGNGLNGTIDKGTPNWKTDGANGYLEFDGGTSVRVEHNNWLNMDKAVTMTALVRSNAFKQWNLVLLKGNTSSIRNYSTFLFGEGPSGEYGKVVSIYNYSNNTEGFLSFSSSKFDVLSLFTWYQIATIIDSENGYRAIYINNKLVKEENEMINKLLVNTQDLYFGYQTSGTNNSGGWPLTGALDEIRIYNRALDKNEINAIYQVDKKKTGNPL